MRRPYIFLFVLFFATILGAGGCSLLDSIKRPNGLASRVGNFSPAKLDTDKSERRAAKNVTPLTPLPSGSRDLDGRQEEFDPAFGTPETEAELNAERTGMNSTRGEAEPAILGSSRAESQFGSIDGTNGGVPQVTPGVPQITTGSAGVPPASTPALSGGGMTLQSSDSSRFGMAAGSIKPSTFDSTLARGNQQGFGCPPAGTAGLGSSTSFGQSQNSFGAPSQAVAVEKPSSGARQNQTPFPGAPSDSQSPVQSSTAFSTTVPSSFGSPDQSDSKFKSASNNFVRPNAFGQMPRLLKSLDDLPEAISRVPSSSGWSFLSWLFTRPPGNANDFALVEAQNSHAKNVDVTVVAQVNQLLADDTQGSPHQRFILKMSTGSSVLVAHNISLASHVPLNEGDYVTVCGEYIWNDKGGVLHYTHHPTSMKHLGGYIDYNHRKYQ